MRKLLILPFFILSLVTYCQNQFPSYPSVLKEFYSRYSYVQDDPVKGLSFAKKKQGWFVHEVNLMTAAVIREELFWSDKNGFIQQLLGFGPGLSGAELEEKLSSVQGNFVYNTYGYERCRYFGYPGWQLDMALDFGQQPVSALSDTLLEGLGRAYSSYANTFLLNQMGEYADPDDTYHRQLAPLEKPSRERVDSAVFYFDKSQEVYEALANRNPSYQTIVGNSGMKLFNEKIHAWMEMSFSGNEELARKYFLGIRPNKTISNFARNYLVNLPLNSILFTAGDNDTYTILYLQEAEKFRKDVTVINLSLLGIPRYVEQLEENHRVRFSTPKRVYAAPSFLYSLFSEKKNAAEMPLGRLIRMIQSKEYPQETANGDTLATYPQQNLQLTVDLAKFRNISSGSHFKPNVHIRLGNYLTMDQFMVLDILSANLYQRPIFFTYSDDLLQQYLHANGLTLQFLPAEINKSQAAIDLSMQKQKYWFSKIYQPTPSNNVVTGISPSNDPVIAVCLNLADYYLSRGNKEEASTILSSLMRGYDNQIPFNLANNRIGSLMIRSGKKEEGNLILEDFVQGVYHLYVQPSALYPYLNKNFILNLVSGVKDELKIYGMESSIVNKTLDALNGD